MQSVRNFSGWSKHDTVLQQPLPDGVLEPEEGSTTVADTVGVSPLAFVCTIVFGLIVSEKLTLPTRAESLIIIIRTFG